MKWPILALWLYLPLISLWGQPFGLNAGTGFETVFLGVEDGLSQGSVYSILKDSRGFMWFSSYEGLNRYDGHHFEVFYPHPSEAGRCPQKYT